MWKIREGIKEEALAPKRATDVLNTMLTPASLESTKTHMHTILFIHTIVLPLRFNTGADASQ